MRILKKGSTGPEVGLLRRLLNRKIVPPPNLPEANVFGARYNGAVPTIDFGPQIDTAVKAFQRSKKLKDDGVVGLLTWRALGPMVLDISRPVAPASQPDGITCYAAAATMVLGPSGSASFNPGPTPQGVAADDHWANTFSRQFGWTLEHGMPPMSNAFASFLHAGPFWFCGDLPFSDRAVLPRRGHWRRLG